VGTTRLQQELFTVYAKSRGWIIKQADFDWLKTFVAKKNKERWQRYQKKIVRNCTAFARITTLHRAISYDRAYQSPAFLDFLHDPEKFFTQQGVSVLKAGRSATVIKIILDGRAFVVKRYNIKNKWHWLRRCLRETRAAASWRLSQRLRLFGIATAKPIAYIENRFLGLRGRSYFVMEYVGGASIGEFFSAYSAEEKHFTQVASLIKDMLHHLAELKITHGDLKMTNILLANDQPLLIDLDGMREHGNVFSFRRTFQKEIKRFMKNWDHYPKVAALFNTLL
jgi:tRNA A-37 threonylcarbamoyl transferase component Bud32